MRVVSVVGARPQFIKLAPIAREMSAARVDHLIVHTGQHYDRGMSDVFFDELAIPEPDVNLAVGSASHARQTAAMMTGLEEVFSDARPDWVLTYGDTNSTLAAALVATKLLISTAHLEAGLRSFNRSMPEEHNRVLTDHASDLLLAPSTTALENLAIEGLRARSVHVGDVMMDVALTVRDSLEDRPAAVPLPASPFVLATIHRQENTDSSVRLSGILHALAAIDLPVVLAAHPRLRQRCHQFGIPLDGLGLDVRAPLTYREMIAALQRASAVVTDSGGLQKEAYFFGVPCTTVRGETEWTETLETGWNVLVDDLAEVPNLVRRRPPDTAPSTPYGSGRAAAQAVEALLRSPVAGSPHEARP